MNFATHLIPQNAAKIAIGVSGGADSFSLLDMMHKRGAAIIALTVDHQLRPESVQEARCVACWCADNGIEHHTLTWSGDKPKTAIQDNARKARRRLLCDFCKAHDITVLLLGHQADDQVETMLMRLQRGTGLQGLCGIAETVIDDATGVKIIRPLLNVRRSELRDYAQRHHLPFIDDPSNKNMEFERPRWRQALQSLPELTHGAILSTQRLARAHEALDQITEKCFQEMTLTDGGDFWLSRTTFAHMPHDIQLRLVHKALLKIKPDESVPLDGLEHLIDAMQADDFSGQTLANCWIRPKIRDKSPGFLIEKSPPRKA